MNDRIPLEQQFEVLVGQIYETLGYRVVAQGGAMDKGYDFTFTDPEGRTGIIGVKLYRTRIIQRQLVVRAAEIVEAIRILAKKDLAILVLGSRLNIPIVNVWPMSRTAILAGRAHDDAFRDAYFAKVAWPWYRRLWARISLLWQVLWAGQK